MKKDYEKMSDDDIIDLVRNNEEGASEGVAYLLYNRHIATIKYFVWRYFGSLDFLDDLTREFYLYFYKNDWHYLRGFRRESIFKTWLSRVAMTFFLNERKKMIDKNKKTIYIGSNISREGCDEIWNPYDDGEERNMYRVIVMEAISKLKNKDQHFIVIKTLQGYKSDDIAKMLIEKDKKEGNVRMYAGKEVELDANYVNTARMRAMVELEKIAKQIEKEWDYENN